MVTNYPQMATHGRLRAATAGTQSQGLGGRLLAWLGQAYCGLHGHDTVMRFEEERMSLRCVSCGHETPGWELNEARPTVTMRGDSRRHALKRPQLVDERRIA
jgi:hypothetical protein